MSEHINFDQITTLSSVAALIAQGLRAYQVDPLPLFEQVGIDIRDVSRPDKRFQTVRMQALWRLAVDASGDECFGLRLSELTQRTTGAGVCLVSQRHTARRAEASDTLLTPR